jgi:hypothetical protein
MRARWSWTSLAVLVASCIAASMPAPARAQAEPVPPPAGANKPAGVASASDGAEPPPPALAPAPPPPDTRSPAKPGPGNNKQFPKLRQPSLLHTYQLGLSVMPGIGFRVIAPYEEGIDCGQQAKRVCTGLLPFFIDVQPSFGFARHWDVLVDLRFGIATDFNQRHQFAVAPGVRYWVDPELGTKFYATIQGVFDATGQNNPELRRNDFGIRNANGFMFEIMRNLGFYLQFGETIGFARWLRFEIDAGVGVQARIP